ncbi:MAG TPA: sigma factor [Puia sp.]|nr:sigma factor [Puia sp.]
MQVSKGDETAFRAVYDLYKGPFYANALRITRSSDAAEEILQEVFIALWNKRVKVGDAINPIGYLFAILHNSIYFHFRKLALEKQMKQRVTAMRI